MLGYIENDTIRAVANTQLSPEMCFYIGYHFVKMLSKDYPDGAKILVGKDTRISGDMLESAFASGVCSAGGNVVCVGIIPAPSMSFLVGKYKMDSAVMIGGGEEAFEYNGICFFSSDGKKYEGEFLKEICKKASHERTGLEFALPEKIGKIKRTHTALRDYADYVKSFASASLSGVKIAVDCANGSSYECAKIIFAELGADTELINNRPDGININANSGISHPKTISDYVILHKRNYGIAFSGDADDFLIVGKDGKKIETKCEGDALICALKTICALSE